MTPTDPRSPQSNHSVTPQRQAAVTKAREAWMRRLVDLSRRNNQLHFRELQRGTLDLTPADPDGLSDLLRGEKCTLADLLPEAKSQQAVANLRAIQTRALENLEDRNLSTLFLAVGLASWETNDGGRPTSAPLLFVPLTISGKSRGGAPQTLERAGETRINPTLLHVLEQELELDCSELNRVDQEMGEPGCEEELVRALGDELSRIARPECPIATTWKAVVGNFSFLKMAMLNELREQSDAMEQHELLAALAGDSTARAAVMGARVSVDPRQLDGMPARAEFLVLDADSSQQAVVRGALSGNSGVIQGPPGTGKSQTIANLLAGCIANGTRVLFVAEKRAAIEVVLARLRTVGLDHLVLDLHGADVSRRKVMERIGTAFQSIKEARPVDDEAQLRKFEEVRARLVEYERALHARRDSFGMTLYEMKGQLLRLSADPDPESRWTGPELAQLSVAVEDIVGWLEELATLSSLYLFTDSSPWTGARLPADGETAAIIGVAHRLRFDVLPRVRARLRDLSESSGLPNPTTMAAAESLWEAVQSAQRTLECFREEIWEQDLDGLAAALAPGARGLKGWWVRLTDATYKQAAARVGVLSRGGRDRLLDQVLAARDVVSAWQRLSSGSTRPRAVEGIADVADLLAEWRELHDRLAGVVSATALAHTTLDELQQRYGALAADGVTLPRIDRVRRLVDGLQRAGAGRILAEIRSREIPSAAWGMFFRRAWLHSAIAQCWAESPIVTTLSYEAHEQDVAKFAALDRDRIQMTAARVRRMQAERAITAQNEYEAQAAILRRESEKRARHMPLRRLVEETSDVLMAICPCWVASPLSVSEILPAGKQFFDLVIFDEASQILPEDAACALLRARQAVVAGDKHQLPPTAFFASDGADWEGDDDEAASTEGFESLLDMMAGFCEPWSLNWHYRSRDESLIAFSNRHIYGDRLVTFPGPGGPPVLRHELVPWQSGRAEEDSPADEVRRVVALVLEHATQRPEESLGVIAMGIKHARRVELAIFEALRERPDLEPFFDTAHHERFFVKNLERVQGDERDAIILTIGYGKDASGRLPYRFGPLLYTGGERRLNVAITRARCRYTVVSSFSHLDMDPSRSSARGVELLRLYLEYASRGGVLPSTSGPVAEPMNDFETDIFDALTARGIPLLPQVGASAYRIDLVAQHPQEPGRFVLAIECDGATYHSAPTARDRDRLRQQHLESLGWRFHRIWSTDWFLQREQEIQRAVAAYDAAVRASDSPVAPRGTGKIGHVHSVSPSAEPLERAVDAAASASSISQRKSPRPNLPWGATIVEYSNSQLIALMDWIESDGCLRTDEEMMREAMQELGFARKGKRIDHALRAALSVRRSRWTR